MPANFQIVNIETREVLTLTATDRRDVLPELLRRFNFELQKTEGKKIGSCKLCTGAFRDDLPHYARGFCKYCYQIGQHRKSDYSSFVPKCRSCEYGRRRDCQQKKKGVCFKDGSVIVEVKDEKDTS